MSVQQFTAYKNDEDLPASGTETILQVIAATNHSLKVVGFGITFAGVAVTGVPIRVELLRQTTAGTSSALTLVKDGTNPDTIDATALQDFTAEPTAGDILHGVRIHPQGGYEIWFPTGKEKIVPSGGRIGLRCITGADNPNCTAFITCEE